MWPNISHIYPPILQYAQELLQTFSTSLGEIALIPVTGGIFTVTITTRLLPPHATEDTQSTRAIQVSSPTSTVDEVLWDRKKDGGFPETKELKNRVRNVIEPERDLGHIDRSLKKGQGEKQEREKTEIGAQEKDPTSLAAKKTSAGPVSDQGQVCKDCP